MGRSLFCLGLLIRYGSSLLTTSYEKNIDIVSNLNLFKRYLRMEDFSVKVRSLQVCSFLLYLVHLNLVSTFRQLIYLLDLCRP